MKCSFVTLTLSSVQETLLWGIFKGKDKQKILLFLVWDFSFCVVVFTELGIFLILDGELAKL